MCLWLSTRLSLEPRVQNDKYPGTAEDTGHRTLQLGRPQDLRPLARLFSFALEAIQVAHWAPLWAPTFWRGFCVL